MPLTDTAIRNAKPSKDKASKLFDEKGLFLLVTPSGGKWWRFKYRFGGKEKLLSFGTYPDVSLKEARDKREEARKRLADGIDPSAHRKAGKSAKDAKAANSLENIAREFMEGNAARWSSVHYARMKRGFEADLFPWLGERPIQDITAPDLLAVAKRIQERGALETAKRAMQAAGQVFRYAIATGRAERDPTADLRGALPSPKSRNHSTIVDPKAVGELLRAIEGYSGLPVMRAALKLAPLVFLRPGELVQAEWSEFDLEAGEWKIPGERMKMNGRHIVPLSNQAVDILRELQPLTGAGRYVFPSATTKGKPMNRETVRASLVRMGYGPNSDTPMTAHGFRGMASTLLHEHGWPSDVIERQLAHAERNKIKAAYNHAEHLPERRKMMQAWADYLDGLRKGADVIPFRRAG